MSMSLFRRLPISSPLVSGAVRAPPTMRMCVRPIVRTYRPMALAATVPRVASRSSFVGAAGLLAGGSLFMGGLLGWNDKSTHCEPAPVVEPPIDGNPKSMVNVYQLSFGTICGLCAGIFIKKGLKIIAFVLGGAYILLQYLATKRLIHIDWNSFKNTYSSSVDRLAGPVDANQNKFQQLPLMRIWRRTIDFLTTDFQERATFIAGLVLGLRLG